MPEVTAKRGGIKYGEAHIPPKPPRAPLPPAPEGSGEGAWIFGIQIADDDYIISSYSSFYPHESFTSPEEAIEFWGELEEGEKVVRCWVPKPYGWEEHS